MCGWYLLLSWKTSNNYQNELVSYILIMFFFNVSIYFIDNKILRFYAIWFYITNVVNNIFLGFFIYLDVIRFKIFHTDRITEKVVRAIFDVDFFYTIRLYTDTINPDRFHKTPKTRSKHGFAISVLFRKLHSFD